MAAAPITAYASADNYIVPQRRSRQVSENQNKALRPLGRLNALMASLGNQLIRLDEIIQEA